MSGGCLADAPWAGYGSDIEPRSAIWFAGTLSLNKFNGLDCLFFLPDEFIFIQVVDGHFAFSHLY